MVDFTGSADVRQAIASADITSIGSFDGSADVRQAIAGSALSAGLTFGLSGTASQSIATAWGSARQHSKIAAHVQGTEVDAHVELFELEIDEAVTLFFTPNTIEGSVGVTFGGRRYVPVPVKAKGFELSSDGAAPQPTLTLGNLSAEGSPLAPETLWTALLIEHNDLLGKRITRKRTFRRFLDDGSDPDPLAIMASVDIYRVEQKKKQTDAVLELRLASWIDQEGRKIPARVMLRDTCTRRYRAYNAATAAFDYPTHNACPYTGADYFDINDQAVGTAAEDVCSQRLTGCRYRFGAGVTLPIWAFPSLGKLT